MDFLLYKRRLISGLISMTLIAGVLLIGLGFLPPADAGLSPAVGVTRRLLLVLTPVSIVLFVLLLAAYLLGHRLFGISREEWYYGRHLTSKDRADEIVHHYTVDRESWCAAGGELIPVLLIMVLLAGVASGLRHIQENYPSPHEMAAGGSVEQMDSLLSTVPFLLHTRNARGETLLSAAVRAGQQPMCELLLERGFNLNHPDRDGRPALSAAAGRPALMRLLLQRGADPKIMDDDGWLPIHHAVANGCGESVRLLVEAGVPVDAQRGDHLTPLLMAVEQDADLLDLLLELGADPNERNHAGETVLHRAVLRNDAGLVTHLLQAGADATLQSYQGWTPLHMAALEGFDVSAEALLQAGVDPAIQSRRQLTPLDCARRNGQQACMDLLARYDAVEDGMNSVEQHVAGSGTR